MMRQQSTETCTCTCHDTAPTPTEQPRTAAIRCRKRNPKREARAWGLKLIGQVRPGDQGELERPPHPTLSQQQIASTTLIYVKTARHRLDSLAADFLKGPAFQSCSVETYFGFLVPGVVTTPIGGHSIPATMASRMRAQNAASILAYITCRRASSLSPIDAASSDESRLPLRGIDLSSARNIPGLSPKRSPAREIGRGSSLWR
jgi:hypothetical protein